jgi:hypothetical protein
MLIGFQFLSEYFTVIRKLCRNDIAGDGSGTKKTGKRPVEECVAKYREQQALENLNRGKQQIDTSRDRIFTPTRSLLQY